MKINLNKIVMAAAVCAMTTIAFADDQAPQTQQMSDTNSLNYSAITPQSFVWMAAMTDMKEIHLGEMALQKSDNADVKSFARRIVADHKKSCKKLQAIAEKEGLNYPSTNSMAWDMNDRWHSNSMVGDRNDHWNTNSGHFENSPMEKQDMDSPPHLASLLVSNADDTADGQQMAGHEMINWDSLSGAEFDRAFVNHMVMGHEKAIRKFEMASATLQDASLKKYANKTLPILREHLRMAQELQSQVSVMSDSGMTNSMYQKTGYSN